MNLALGLALVPWLGGVGAALATALAYVAAALILAREVRRRLGFSISIFTALHRPRAGRPMLDVPASPSPR